MQRYPHTIRRARRRDPRQHHPIQRQARHVTDRTVNRNDPPFDRTIITPAQHRFTDPLRPRARQHEPQRHKCKKETERPPDQWHNPCQDQRRHTRRRDQRVGGKPRLDLGEEIPADAAGQSHRHPAEHMPALRKDCRLQMLCQAHLSSDPRLSIPKARA